MFETVVKNFWLGAFNFMPSITIVLMAIIGLTPVGSEIQLGMGLNFIILILFFWASHPNVLLPYWLIFLVGLVLDSVSGPPIGLQTLVLLVIAGMSDSQRHIFVNKSFYVSWLGAATLSFCGLLFMYSLSCLYHLHLFNPSPVVQQWVIGVVVYPVIALCLGSVRSYLHDVALRHA